MTLAFLGYRPEEEIDAIAAAVSASEAVRAPLFAPGEVVGLPPRRPRLFALDLVDRDGAAVELQESVVSALEEGGFHRREKRRFWPHLTLARVKRDRRAGPLPPRPPELEPFAACALTLYRSVLRPQGAEYRALATIRLQRAWTGGS